MESSEENYSQRMQEIKKRLAESKIKKRVDNFLAEMTEELKCSVEIFFNAYPEVEDYEEYMENEEYVVPRGVVSMNLGSFIDHISKEDREYKMYLDPIYMKPGVNEINDVLTTTVKDCVIIVPVTTKK